MRLTQSLRFGTFLSLAIAAQSVHGLQPQSRTLTQIDGPFRLTGRVLRVTFLEAKSVRAALEQSSDITLFMVVRGLSAQREPGTSFTLYVDLPDGSSAREKELHRIGSLNFFGTRPSSDEDSNNWRSFEFTALARRLLALGQLAGPISMTVEANSTPLPGSEATIASIAIVQP